MHAERFDAATQALITTTPRRATLGGLLAGGLAGLLSRLSLEDAEARKNKNKRRKKKRRKKKCKKTCNSSNACEATSCNKKGKCKRTNQPEGTECGADSACCDGQCRDLATDADNCGTCELDCLSGQCERGACLCGGQEECNAPCYCRTRLGGQLGVCNFGRPNQPPCDSDDDCPFQSVCLSTNFCSDPCPV